MTTPARMLKVDNERFVQSIEEVREKLGVADGEVVLDFSAVARLDPGVVRALQTLADHADEAKVRIALREVGVDAYKVLKLANLSSRFAFVE